MPGSKKKNPLRPSYQNDELRDKSIEKRRSLVVQPKAYPMMSRTANSSCGKFMGEMR